MTWELIEQMAMIVTAVLGGGGAVVVVSKLKSKLNLHGDAAIALTAVVAVLVAIAGLVANGVLSPDGLKIDNLSVLVVGVWVASQKIYDRLKK